MDKDKPEKVRYDIISLIRENWAWVAPLTYIYVTLVGMIQEWFPFSAFGINIFEYSELNDFLLAAFREPLSFLAILGLFAYVFIIYAINRIQNAWLARISEARKDRKFPLNLIPDFLLQIWRSRFSQTLNRLNAYLIFAVTIVGAPFYVPLIFNDGFGDQWKEDFLLDPFRQVEVLTRGSEKYNVEDGWIKNIVFIGTTDKFLFFYDKTEHNVLVTPVSNVLLIKKGQGQKTKAAKIWDG